MERSKLAIHVKAVAKIWSFQSLVTATSTVVIFNRGSGLYIVLYLKAKGTVNKDIVMNTIALVNLARDILHNSLALVAWQTMMYLSAATDTVNQAVTQTLIFKR